MSDRHTAPKPLTHNECATLIRAEFWDDVENTNLSKATWRQATRIAALVAVVEEQRAALEEIANGHARCETCGKPHEERSVSRDGNGSVLTWADPEDDHVYRPRPFVEVARAVLGRGSGRGITPGEPE